MNDSNAARLRVVAQLEPLAELVGRRAVYDALAGSDSKSCVARHLARITGSTAERAPLTSRISHPQWLDTPDKLEAAAVELAALVRALTTNPESLGVVLVSDPTE